MKLYFLSNHQSNLKSKSSSLRLFLSFQLIFNTIFLSLSQERTIIFLKYIPLPNKQSCSLFLFFSFPFPLPFNSITFSMQETRRNIKGRSTFENSPFENRRSLASTSLDLSPIRRVKSSCVCVCVCIDHYHDLRQCWPPTCTHRTLINAPDFGPVRDRC